MNPDKHTVSVLIKIILSNRFIQWLSVLLSPMSKLYNLVLLMRIAVALWSIQ